MQKVAMSGYGRKFKIWIKSPLRIKISAMEHWSELWLERSGKHIVQYRGLITIALFLLLFLALIRGNFALLISAISALFTYKAVAITERRLSLEDNRVLAGIEPHIFIKKASLTARQPYWSLTFNFKDNKTIELLEVEFIWEEGNLIDCLQTNPLYSPWHKKPNQNITTTGFFKHGAYYTISDLPDELPDEVLAKGCTVVLKYNGVERLFQQIAFE